MSKLSLEALKERAEAVASEDLLNSISGGTENACHDGKKGSSWRDLAIGIETLLFERNFGK